MLSHTYTHTYTHTASYECCKDQGSPPSPLLTAATATADLYRLIEAASGLSWLTEKYGQQSGSPATFAVLVLVDVAMIAPSLITHLSLSTTLYCTAVCWKTFLFNSVFLCLLLRFLLFKCCKWSPQSNCIVCIAASFTAERDVKEFACRRIGPLSLT